MSIKDSVLSACAEIKAQTNDIERAAGTLSKFVEKFDGIISPSDMKDLRRAVDELIDMARTIDAEADGIEGAAEDDDG